MALVLLDRVLESTVTAGLGSISLGGAVTGYQTFADVPDSDTCPYAIWAVDAAGAPTGQWEVGVGTKTGTTLARTTLLDSSTGSAIDFAAGTKRVALVLPASLSAILPITFANMQAVSANILLGNDAAGTAVQEIACTAFARTVLDDADAATVRATIGAGTGSGNALTSGTLAQFAATTSLELKGVISNETGSGALVFADTPTLVTPIIGAATGTSLILSSLVRASNTPNGVCEARLTTESGVAVSTTDRTAQGTIYLTPFNGNRIGLSDGTNWLVYPLTQISLSLSGVTAGKNYTVWCYNNAGTLTLELSAEWTNDTTPADAIVLQDGIKVKSGAIIRRVVGTIRASASNVTADSMSQRFVHTEDARSRVLRLMQAIDTTDFWSYVVATIRQANAATGNKVEYVTGDAASLVIARAICGNQNVSAGTTNIGVGVDSTTTFSGLRGIGYNLNIAAIVTTLVAEYSGYPGLGYHYLSWNEKGAAGAAGNFFYGDSGGDGTQSGLNAWMPG